MLFFAQKSPQPRIAAKFSRGLPVEYVPCRTPTNGNEWPRGLRKGRETRYRSGLADHRQHLRRPVGRSRAEFLYHSSGVSGLSGVSGQASAPRRGLHATNVRQLSPASPFSGRQSVLQTRMRRHRGCPISTDAFEQSIRGYITTRAAAWSGS